MQAQDRIHRISQKRICYISNLIMNDSIDEWVEVLLNAKHLAAKLGQGDITTDEYKSAAEYDFPYVLKNILNIENLQSLNKERIK